MGCDIHMLVQKRDAGGVWRFVDARGYGERNYHLFAVLAGVRNGTGFAGVKAAEPIQPIAGPRGVPADFQINKHGYTNRWLRDRGEGVWLGDHSHSHATLAEIQAYAWDQPHRKCGVVNAANYALFKERGAPEECGSIEGPGIRHVSNAEMERTIAAGATTNLYTQISWTVPLRESIGEGWFAFMDMLASIGAPADVRIVFGFDS